jgi:hypothetical protein
MGLNSQEKGDVKASSQNLLFAYASADCHVIPTEKSEPVESEIRDVMGVMINTTGAVRSLPQYWLTLRVSFSDFLILCVSLIPSQFLFLSLNLNPCLSFHAEPNISQETKEEE